MHTNIVLSMSMRWKDRVIVYRGDITKLETEVIVNAANSSLLGGGGVDGAIHRAAGPELVHECRLLGGCKIGQAKLTGGYKLAAKHIVHTVGPVWQGGDKGEPALLAACYRESLELVRKIRASSIAFPCISTGIFGYPLEEACRVAVASVQAHLRHHESPSQVILCAFDEEARAALQAALVEASDDTC